MGKTNSNISRTSLEVGMLGIPINQPFGHHGVSLSMFKQSDHEAIKQQYADGSEHIKPITASERWSNHEPIPLINRWPPHSSQQSLSILKLWSRSLTNHRANEVSLSSTNLLSLFSALGCEASLKTLWSEMPGPVWAYPGWWIGWI